MRYKLLIAISLIIGGCNTTPEDISPEDYDTLFPFKGIEKPEITYEDMTHNQCNISNYKYPGVSLDTPKRKYTVTIKCKYSKGYTKNDTPSFLVKYVGKDKKLKTIGSDATAAGLTEAMEANKEKTVSIELESGYPMYLSVSGKGNRETRIEASIEAISTDGIVSIPKLSYAISQNKIGVYEILPYCEYIVLP